MRKVSCSSGEKKNKIVAMLYEAEGGAVTINSAKALAETPIVVQWWQERRSVGSAGRLERSRRTSTEDAGTGSERRAELSTMRAAVPPSNAGSEWTYMLSGRKPVEEMRSR